MRILLSGYYGFGNAGDEALLEGLVTGLRQLGHQPVVLSADPAATAALHGVEAAHRLRGLPAALLRADALVSGGGGLLQDTTSLRSLRYYLGVLRAARLLHRPVAVYAQSVGPLSPAGREAVKRGLQHVPIAVRDRRSQELLGELGLRSERVADPALLLRPSWVRDGMGSSNVLVPRAGYPELGDALIAVGRARLAAGEEVELLAMHGEEDGAELERLRRALPQAAVARARDHRQALQVIARSRLVVSARLHGLILAAVAERPYVGLIYDPKVAGFLEEAGAVGFAPPVDLPNLLDHAARATRPPEEARRNLLERASSGISWLDGVLRQTPRGS